MSRIYLERSRECREGRVVLTEGERARAEKEEQDLPGGEQSMQGRLSCIYCNSETRRAGVMFCKACK